ncbi:DUF4241 domain-containing protein [Micromonospora sp. NBC_00389]
MTTRRLLPGQDIASLGDEDFFGYAVDAGTGTLADQVPIEALREWDFERVDEVFIPAQVPEHPIDAVVTAVVEEQTGANVYVVGSGWGDGVYATYVGRTAEGRIASFVTDFRHRAARIAFHGSAPRRRAHRHVPTKIGRTHMPLSRGPTHE